MPDSTPPAAALHDVTLSLEQPAALGRGPRGDTTSTTYRHVPGSVVRGALARAWMLEHGEPQSASAARRAEFTHLFEGGVRYGPLFDAASDVVPLSVHTCKYRPLPGCLSSFADHAVAAARAGTGACTECGGPMQAGRGEVEFFGTEPGLVETTHVALDSDERAADGQLFNRRALASRVHGSQRTLTGHLFATADERNAWLLQPQPHPVRVGGRRSISGGATCQVSTSTPLSEPTIPADDDTLLLRLQSPAVLVDPAGRPTRQPDEAQLAQLLGVRDVSVHRSWLRTERVGGWNALTNLPKPAELAVSAGSVYQLAVDGTLCPSGTRQLLAHGLGIRRAEGFGALALGPWTPPRLTAAAKAPLRERMSDGVARQLEETGEGAWFLDQLRHVLLAQRTGAQPDMSFLNKRRAQVLADHGSLQRFFSQFGQYAGELEDIVVKLEARVRKVRAG